MAQLFSSQEILNRCFDSVNNCFVVSGTNTKPNHPSRFSEQEILNRVFNAAGNYISTTPNSEPNHPSRFSEQYIWNKVFNFTDKYIYFSTNSDTVKPCLKSSQDILNLSYDTTNDIIASSANPNGYFPTRFSVQEILNKIFDPVNNTLGLFSVLGLDPLFYVRSDKDIFSDGSQLFSSANKDYATIPSNSTLQTGDIDFEVGGLVYGCNGGGILGKYNDGNREFLLHKSSGKFIFIVSSNGSATTSLTTASTYADDAWFFVRGWHDSVSNTINIQVNNGTVESTAFSSGVFVGTTEFMIGAYKVGDIVTGCANGKIDSAYFQKRISTPEEATALYNNGNGRTYSDLTAENGLDTFKNGLTSWWDMNEEDGVLIDSKGSNNLTRKATSLINPSVFGSELLANGDFETVTADDFANWNESPGADGAITDETTIIHSGSHAVKVTIASGTAYLSQTKTGVVAGQKYQASFWSRGNGSVSARYGIRDNTAGTFFVPISSTNNSTTTWKLTNVQFTIPANCTSISLYLYSSSTAGDVYFDDASLKLITTEGTLNGGFEMVDGDNNFTNWAESASGSSTINEETDLAHINSGVRACRMDIDSSNSNASISIASIILTNKKYKATFSAKVSDATGSPTARIFISGAGTSTYDVNLTTSYQQFVIYFTANDINSGFYLTRGSNCASKSIWFDDVTLESVGSILDSGIASGISLDGNFCASYDGTNQYLSVANNASLQSGDIDFEVGGWVNFDKSSRSQDLLSKYNSSGNNREYRLWVNSGGKVVFSVTPDGNLATVQSATSAFTLSINQWYFIRAWHDSVNNTLNLQINNGTNENTSYSNGVFVGNSDFTIGKMIGAGYLDGRIDGVYKINRILTTDEATAMYNKGKGVKYANLPTSVKNDSNLKAYWDLDEKSGTRYDSTANDNDLADTGTVTQGRGVNYNEGVVSLIKDSTLNLNNFVQTNPFKRPAYDSLGINNKPAMLFDGVDDGLMASGDKIGAGDVTVTTVIKPTGWGGNNNGRIIDNGKLMIFNTGTGTIHVSSTGGSGINSVDNSISLNTSYVITVTRTSVGITNIYINGVLSGSADQNSGTPVAGTNTYLGNRSAGDRYFNGYIGEVIKYDKILPLSEIKSVENYLANKYGITL